MLVYTAVTRGKRLVVIVGRPEALALAIMGAQARRRWSKLRDRLTRWRDSRGQDVDSGEADG